MSLITDHFDKFEAELDTRIHSLEIQLDLFLDSTTTNSFFNNTDKIILRNKCITKDKVGKLTQYKIFGKVKSTSFVNCKHDDVYTQDFMRRCDLEPCWSIIPKLVSDYENYIAGIVRHDILFTLSYDYTNHDKVFRIYYNQTNVVKFKLDGNLHVPDNFEIHDNNIYFFCNYRFKYIFDFSCNINMNFVRMEYGTKQLDTTTHMFDFSDYKCIYGLCFTELYAVVRAREAFFFFHKKSLLYSHKNEGDFRGNLDYTYMGNWVNGANCFVKVYNDFYTTFSFSGIKEYHSFGCDIIENMLANCCKSDNEKKKEYDVCRVEPNCVWYCLRYPYKYPNDYNLIKVEF